ncbi:serine hydrolase domain-containing protein [Hydrocarboniclastica marina]|uniref:Class A beta-lactamase-related serine hydrolase n=1 Tax=Hydrocarboniclastica marina TaxID=2259620 RepID=A0A4P7XI30_9ALTE|nr:serine hydrolase domain-containing protein [Hydrocarboniclastica marina]QCF26154.1 class A beta-lactamase-related serine hydrolase [Hydrocarboniclastica marina]
MIRAVLLIVLAGLAGFAHGAPEGKVRQVLTDLQERFAFPGATVAWTGPDDTVHALAIGMADPDCKRQMSPDTPMLAASIGKSFVAAAILRAAEEEQLDLDSPISNWLGKREWFHRLPNHKSLTLRHLLTHTGGLPDHVYLPAFQALFQKTFTSADAPDTQQLIGLILDTDPLFAPGEGWEYSDTGYLLAAQVLEAVTGDSWTDYVGVHFLKPLDLEATTPSDQRLLPGLATGFTSADNPLGLPERSLDEEGLLVWHPAVEGAGGGFVSSAVDLARWGRALWSGRLHSEGSFKAMMTGAAVSEDRPGVSYGLGVVIEPTEQFGEVRGHRGWIPGYVSSLRYYPEYDIAIAIQINSDIGMMGQEGSFVEVEAGITQAILNRYVKGQ